MHRTTAAARMVAALLGLLAAPALAEDTALERLGKAAGLIAPTPDPPDFVKASRPAKEPDEIPVFAAPPEPTSHVKTPSELKAMDADLEKAGGGSASPAKAKRRKGAAR